MNTTPESLPQHRVVIISGLAGAGLNTARTALEDLGFRVVDNPPLGFLPALMEHLGKDRSSIAFGIDVRTEGFSAEGVIDFLNQLNAQPHTKAKLVFVDCDDETLLQRFSETRRRHPLATDRPVADGIRRERELLAPIRKRADLVLDTAQLSIHDLRRILGGHFPADVSRDMLLQVMSFSYRQGVPREADLVFDARFLRNPHWVPALKPHTGQNGEVGDYIQGDEAFAAFWAHLTSMLTVMVPRFRDEGKKYFTIAFGCTGGKHRSVYLAERTGAWLNENGFKANVHHREQKI